MKLIDRMDSGHPDNRKGMKEHEHPYWNEKKKPKIAENYHERTPAQKSASAEEHHEHANETITKYYDRIGKFDRDDL